MPRFGSPHEHFEVTDSTNARAREAAERGAAHGTLFTAGAQTAGRGRQGRSWYAAPGSALLMSVIARPVIERYELAPLATALAVAETCELLADVRAEIKWPNDVWIEERKVAGILIESRPHHEIECSWMVIGIGLNTSVALAELPEELRETAASLQLPPGTDALTPLLERLEHHLHADSAETIAAWRRRDALKGRRVAWGDESGTAAGIDDTGNLLVDGPEGTTALRAGEVHLNVG